MPPPKAEQCALRIKDAPTPVSGKPYVVCRKGDVKEGRIQAMSECKTQRHGAVAALEEIGRTTFEREKAMPDSRR
jgi:hypothetical protein